MNAPRDLPVKRMQPKACKGVCGGKFVPTKQMQPTCGVFECQVAYAESVAQKSAEKRRKQAAKEERKATKARKDELKPLQHFLKRTERAVNAYCRERDAEEGCISCGTHDAIEWHAGHFIPVGRSSFLRYDPANIHKQCDHCNIFKGGNATEYEKRLPARIGLAEVDRLKTAPRLRTWTREELLAIETEFKAMLAAWQANQTKDPCQ